MEIFLPGKAESCYGFPSHICRCARALHFFGGQSSCNANHAKTKIPKPDQQIAEAIRDWCPRKTLSNTIAKTNRKTYLKIWEALVR